MNNSSPKFCIHPKNKKKNGTDELVLHGF